MCSNKLHARWKSLGWVHRVFSYESTADRILKIGPHLPKLLTNIKWLTFFRYDVDFLDYRRRWNYMLLAQLSVVSTLMAQFGPRDSWFHIFNARQQQSSKQIFRVRDFDAWSIWCSIVDPRLTEPIIVTSFCSVRSLHGERRVRLQQEITQERDEQPSWKRLFMCILMRIKFIIKVFSLCSCSLCSLCSHTKMPAMWWYDTIRYDTVYLMWSIKLTDSQFSAKIFSQPFSPRGCYVKGSMKKSRFSTKISSYLRHDARYGHVVHGGF